MIVNTQKMSFSCESLEVGSPERLWLLYKHQGSDSFHFRSVVISVVILKASS